MIYETADSWSAMELGPSRTDAVDRLLTGSARIAPVAHAEGDQVLTWLAGGRDTTLSETATNLDAALAKWCDARLAESWSDVQRVGVEVYSAALIDVFNALPVANLPRTSAMVRDRIAEFDGWCSELAAHASRDVRAILYDALTEIQTDRRFLSTWYRFCEQAGRGELPDPSNYVQIALLGLRKLPAFDDAPDDSLRPEALTGLARYGRHLSETPENHRAFLGAWCTVTARHRDAEETHADQIQDLLRRHSGKPFVKWWAEILGWSEPGHGPTPFIEAPTLDELNRLCHQLKSAQPDEIYHTIQSFVNRHEKHANATGHSEYLLRAFNQIGNTILDRAPDLARELAETALTHDSSDAHSWVLWSDALNKLGRETDAEAVLWEARRRLIDRAHVRNQLGDLLVSRGRLGEAEWMYRDTMRRFPDDPATRTALAYLLAKNGRPDAAEELLRETVQRFRDNDRVRNLLARVLIDIGRESEGERWYRETTRKFPDDRPSRLDLGLFLLSQGRADEAETLLQGLQEIASNASDTKTLAHWLEKCRAGERYPWRPLSSKAPASESTLPADWANRAPVEAQVSRALFLAEAPKDDAALLLSKEGAKQLRDEAQETLVRLQKTRPHNLVVRLIALRRQRGATQQIADLAEPTEFAPAALRLAWARHTGDMATIDHFIDENGPLAPVAAIARLEYDDAKSEVAAQTLVQFYHARLGADASAIRRQVQNNLHRLIKPDHHAIGDAKSFLDVWAEELGPEDRRAFGDLVDHALLSSVEDDVPFALLGGTHEQWGEPVSV